MKRSLFLIVLGLIAWAAFAEDELEFYTNQFNHALTAVDQLSVLRIVRGEPDSDGNHTQPAFDDAGTFYVSALKRILQVYPNLRGNKELDAADESIRLITDQLTEDQTEAGQDLWRVVQIFSNPLVKADAVMALGKVGATDLFPQVVQLLKDTNSSPYTNRVSGERIAYGAIDALANYKDPAGYLPVFFAANGWYSDRVKSKAQDTLDAILDDPSEALTEVIQSGGYTYDEKYLALRAVEKSEKIDDSAKAGVAVEALYQGWRGKGSPNDVRMQKELVRMRKLAITMISEYGTDDERVYKLLESSYRYGIDEEELLGVVGALKKLASEDASNLLATFIALMNNKFERGILTVQDERLMRALIPALGETGNAAGQPVLRHVISLSWGYTIRQLAQEALDKLGG